MPKKRKISKDELGNFCPTGIDKRDPSALYIVLGTMLSASSSKHKLQQPDQMKEINASQWQKAIENADTIMENSGECLKFSPYIKGDAEVDQLIADLKAGKGMGKIDNVLRQIANLDIINKDLAKGSKSTQVEDVEEEEIEEESIEEVEEF